MPGFQKLEYSPRNEPHPPILSRCSTNRTWSKVCRYHCRSRDQTACKTFWCTWTVSWQIFSSYSTVSCRSSTVSCSLTAKGQTVQSPRDIRAMQAFKASFSSVFHVPWVQRNTAKPRSWQSESDFLTEIKREVTRWKRPRKANVGERKGQQQTCMSPIS